MRSYFLRSAAVAAVSFVAACQNDVASPVAASVVASDRPAFLVAPGEAMRTLVDSVDASGNTIMVVEYAAGTVPAAADGTPRSSVASVTIRTFIPRTNTSGKSSSCISSTIQGIETTTGWTATVKKSGGCDKPIEVGLENATTKQRAEFSFLMQPGKTRIDFGAVR